MFDVSLIVYNAPKLGRQRITRLLAKHLIHLFLDCHSTWRLSSWHFHNKKDDEGSGHESTCIYKIIPPYGFISCFVSRYLLWCWIFKEPTFHKLRDFMWLSTFNIQLFESSGLPSSKPFHRETCPKQMLPIRFSGLIMRHAHSEEVLTAIGDRKGQR